MNRRDFVRTSVAGVSALSLGSLAALAKAPRKRPNIIVIYTDDQGYADLGAQGYLEDIQTPHLDALATDGIRCTDGYVTAPQCAPSRAGLLTGRYQQRFDMEHIPEGPLPLTETTLADHLSDAGYKTGMVGKWHLEPNIVCVEWAQKTIPDFKAEKPGRIPPKYLTLPRMRPYMADKRGFDEVFQGEIQNYWANFKRPDGKIGGDPQNIRVDGYRLDVQTEAAVDFIERNTDKDAPFFLYLAYFAPHVPPEAIEKYLKRFPGEMPERRRYALAMMAAIDEGVGRIRETLEACGEYEDTLFFFISDNGAPLHRLVDLPISHRGGAWDGSLNTPLTGEKGMLLEGGIRVPFLVSWKAGLPSGQVFKEPISALDVFPTCMAAAGLSAPANLDGVDMLPVLRGQAQAPDRALFWRFWGQAAIREGDWKYVYMQGDKEMLFNIGESPVEKDNLIDAEPERARTLHQKLETWAAQLDPPGLPSQPPNAAEKDWYKRHLNHEV